MSEFDPIFNDKLLHIVEKTITTYGMLEPEDSVLIGVSGGPDSVALLHILNALAPKFSLKLGVAHLNHDLRHIESDNDAEFVAILAKSLAIPCYVRKENVKKYQIENKLSLEEAARRVRYAFFYQVAKQHNFSKIALGHHYDDNAELVLMNLFRGSGPLGLSGIPPIRNNKVIRPLINSQRNEIIDFLKANRFEYVADQSNIETRYLRNRIRHHLIPHLKAEYNPNIIETLNRLAAIIHVEEQWIQHNISQLFNKILVSRQDNHVVLAVSKLKRAHLAQQRRIIRKAIHLVKGNLRRISFTHTDAVVGLLTDSSGGKNLDLPNRIRVRSIGDSLIFTKESDALRDRNGKYNRPEKIAFNYVVEKPISVFLKEINMHMAFSDMDYEHVPNFHLAGQHTAFIDKYRVRFPLTIRNFRAGDRFSPLGTKGTQKVKKYFIDKKVPLMDRYRCPLLVSQGKIIWVGGHRIDESVKLTPSTRKVLKIELLLA